MQILPRTSKNLIVKEDCPGVSAAARLIANRNMSQTQNS
jgi:hypothetical protein